MRARAPTRREHDKASERTHKDDVKFGLGVRMFGLGDFQRTPHFEEADTIRIVRISCSLVRATQISSASVDRSSVVHIIS